MGRGGRRVGAAGRGGDVFCDDHEGVRLVRAVGLRSVLLAAAGLFFETRGAAINQTMVGRPLQMSALIQRWGATQATEDRVCVAAGEVSVSVVGWLRISGAAVVAVGDFGVRRKGWLWLERLVTGVVEEGGGSSVIGLGFVVGSCGARYAEALPRSPGAGRGRGCRGGGLSRGGCLDFWAFLF